MNFSSDSVKHESKSQNEDFYFDLETPRGHFFAVVDFDTHDFANLNATLKGKLETIVSSFVSLSRFSADLFLGFLAKEINNFLHNLREQAGGPQLVGSAALCLLTGDRLTYLRCGNITISTYRAGKASGLGGGESDVTLQKLGRSFQETPLTESVQSTTLEDDDVALVMTSGVASVLDSQKSGNPLEGLSDALSIREALMQASAAAKDDRTLLVITGPYERYVDPVLSDLSRAVASLEARLDALSETNRLPIVAPLAPQVDNDALRQLENRLAAQIELVREDLRDKAGSIDVLELDEKVKTFGTMLTDKADNADVLALQSDLLKLSVAADTSPEPMKVAADPEQLETASVSPISESRDDSDWQRSLLLKVAGIVLLLGFGGAFLGAWLQSRLMKRNASESPTVAAMPAPTAVPTPQPSPSPVEAATPAEMVVRPGDSLKKLAQQFNVPEQTIMELNPTIKRWGAIRPGQKILVPAAPVAEASPSISNAAPPAWHH